MRVVVLRIRRRSRAHLIGSDQGEIGGAERALSLGRERSASTSFRETKGWNKVESGAQRSGVRRGVRACRWA